MTATPITLLDRLCNQPAAEDWNRLVRLFTPLLFQWARRLGVPASDAEDLLQEVFAILVRKLPDFRYDASKSFHAWLWTIFRHAASDWRKRRARQLPALDAIEAVGGEDPASLEAAADYSRYLARRVLAVLQADFSPQTWQLFWQTVVDGRPGVDVAAEHGVTPNAVYLARTRVLSRLRHELADLDA